MEVWNYIAEGIENGGKLLRVALESVIGTSVEVAPLDDEYAAKLGIWLRGKIEEIREVREILEKELNKKKIEFEALLWTEARRRG